jgi:hypothetical protein
MQLTAIKPAFAAGSAASLRNCWLVRAWGNFFSL